MILRIVGEGDGIPFIGRHIVRGEDQPFITHRHGDIFGKCQGEESQREKDGGQHGSYRVVGCADWCVGRQEQVVVGTSSVVCQESRVRCSMYKLCVEWVCTRRSEGE